MAADKGIIKHWEVQVHDNGEFTVLDGPVPVAGSSNAGQAGAAHGQPSESSDGGDNAADMRFLSGTPDIILNWFRILEAPHFYEVVGQVVSFTPPRSLMPQIIAVRYTYGPVLKVACFPRDYVNLPKFQQGMWIRCVGRKFCDEAMRAFSIRMATEVEIQTIVRRGCVCIKSLDKPCVHLPHRI